MSSFEKARAAGLLVEVAADVKNEQIARAREWEAKLLAERVAAKFKAGAK